MFSLDDIIDASSPRILSTQHDTSAINWVAGMSDPGEMIACGAYQELRRQNGEADAEYQARIEYLLANLPADHAAKIRAAGASTATKRAALDTSTGKVAVMVAGKPPWHRLGVNVASAVNSTDAARLASIDWTVSKRSLAYQHPIGGETYISQRDVFAIVRDDTGAYLGNVGSRYQPIQQSDGFGFLDSVLADYGARYETAGAIHGGKKVWMQVKLPNQSFAVNGSDEVQAFATFTNSHDGSGQAWCYPTTDRIVCGNTFRVAQEGKGRGIGMRHTGDIKGRIADAKAALGIAVHGFSEFKEAAEAMTRAPLPSIRNYANDVLDAVLDVTAAQTLMGADALAATLLVADAVRDLERKSIAKKIERRGEILADILDRYDGERCGINGMRGTVWAGFNALTERADYGNGQRHVGTNEAQLSRRMESVLAGDADTMKQAAYSRAMQLV